jgi:chemotaxis protein MotB
MVARTRRSAHSANIWPGFVDALSTLLLVLIFLLVVFILAEFFLGRALSGRDQALAQLNQQVLELADLLSLEKQANIDLRGDVNQLSAQLQASTADRDDLSGQVTFLLARQQDLLKELEAAAAATDDQETTVDDLKLQLAAALAMLEAAQATEQELRDAAGAARGDLTEERRVSSAAQRQVALLNQQIAQIRIQLAAVQRALEASEAKVGEQKIELADLGNRLNVALASKVEELSRYRSEFFGRLREVLAGRSDVSIQGDRFVIQSGVLFDTASAEFGPAGRQQVADLAALLLEITTEIPPDLNWILRIDGHTDKRPISTAEFRSNWELSAARAITVAQHLIDAGVPPERLAATGFGEFHPLDEGESEVAYRSNRRIELKLTER